MNKFFATLSLLALLATSQVWAQGYGGFSGADDDDQDELPVPQPTPSVDVPPPMDFGQDSGSGDYSDYSGSDN